MDHSGGETQIFPMDQAKYGRISHPAVTASVWTVEQLEEVVSGKEVGGVYLDASVCTRENAAKVHESGKRAYLMLPQVWREGMARTVKDCAPDWLGLVKGEAEASKPVPPGILETVLASVNIAQDRIARSRMAGDPPDVLVTPRLGHLGLLDFHRAEEAIAEGRWATEEMRSAIEFAIPDAGPAHGSPEQA